MTSPLPALRDFSDRLSPMVVKEMRQGLRTRFFTAALIVFHAVLGCLMMAFISSFDHQEIHEMFWTVISVTLLAVLPSRAFDALHSEVKDGTLDMLLLTGMPSFRIVWGKWVSLYSQTLLVAGSLLPYMIVRYQFGGVEIVREMLSLLALVVGSGLATASLIGFSSQKLKLVRLVTAALTGIGAFSIGLFAYFTACEPAAGQEVIHSLTAHGLPIAFLIILWTALLACYLGYLFLCVGSARIPGLPDSHQVLKRKVAFTVMAVLSAVAWWICAAKPYGLSGYNAQNAILASSFLPSLLFGMLLCMDLCTEEIPHDGTSASAGILARPGWPSGILTSLALSLFPMLNHGAMAVSTGSTDYGGWYATTCFLTAGLIPICVPTGRRFSQFSQFSVLSRWWLIQMVIGMLGFVLMVGAEAVSSNDRDIFRYLTLVTPTTGIFGSVGIRGFGRDMFYSLGTFANGLWVLLTVLIAFAHLKSTRRSIHDESHA
ncbi:MAG: hypothetical protein V4662_14695 [Verrucomicrobiota bacterium]